MTTGGRGTDPAREGPVPPPPPPPPPSSTSNPSSEGWYVGEAGRGGGCRCSGMLQEPQTRASSPLEGAKDSFDFIVILNEIRFG